METWRRQVAAASLAWCRLTEDELHRLEGHTEQLIRLLQERYGVTREIAARQVQSFFTRPPI